MWRHTATMLVPRQYTLAMLVITPLALLVNQWAAPQPVDLLLRARILETLIGSGIALAVVLADVAARRPTGAPRSRT